MSIDEEVVAAERPAAVTHEVLLLRYADGSIVVPDGNGRFRLTIQSTDAAKLTSRDTDNLVDAELQQTFGRYSIADQSNPYPVNENGTDWEPIDPVTRRMRPRPPVLLYRRDWTIRRL